MAYGGRPARVAGAGAFALLLGGCGARAAVVESADAAPPEPTATAARTPGASAEASADPDCTPPPLPPKPANWDDDGDGPSFQHVVDQEAVDNALAPAHELAERLEGFAVARIEGPRHGAVWWKGTPPPEVAALAGTNADCVQVDVGSVPYSADDIRAAARRVLEAERASDPRPNGAQPMAGYTGIEVGYEVVPQGPAADDLRRRLEPLAGLPVSFGQMGPTYG